MSFFSAAKNRCILYGRVFVMGRTKLEQKEQKRTQDIFSKDVKLTETFFSLGIVDVGKVRGCSVSGICAYGFIQKLSMIWFQSTIVEGI